MCESGNKLQHSGRKPPSVEEDTDVPEEVLTVIDKISEQLEAVISSLVTIEKRVCNNEENISKLNMVIYRRL